MTQTAELTPQSLIAYLRDEMSVTDPLDADTELFSSGLLDSVAMMSVIAFVEERTGADVRPADVTLDNFDTVSRIVAYAATLD
jgi:acyl carrier protein